MTFCVCLSLDPFTFGWDRLIMFYFLFWNVKSHHLLNFPPSKKVQMTKSARLWWCCWCWRWKWILNEPSLASLSSLPTNFPISISFSSVYFSYSLSPSLCLQQSLVWQWNNDLHIVEREESWLAVQISLVPVLVDLTGQGDDIALVEA